MLLRRRKRPRRLRQPHRHLKPYRLQNRKDMGIVMADEAFFILFEYNSGKYEIRDYEDNVIFSWIEPDQYEYW